MTNVSKTASIINFDITIVNLSADSLQQPPMGIHPSSGSGNCSYSDCPLTDGGKTAVTEPVELKTDVMLVTESMEGDVLTGKLLLGQNELVIYDSSGTLRITFDSLTDIAPGYTPRSRTASFDNSVAISFEAETGQDIIIVELIDLTHRRFLVSLLSVLLDAKPALIAHPTKRGEQETEETLEKRELSAYPYELEFDGNGKRGTGETIKFSSIIHLDETRLYYEDDHHAGLAIRHLQTIGPPLTTELRLISERHHTVAKRILMWEYNRRARKIKRLTLSTDEKDLLHALHDSHRGRSQALTAALDKPPQELSAILSSIKEKRLVRESGTRLKLTQTGYMLFTHEKI